MLALAGLLTIVVVLAAILSKRMSPFVALGAIPVLAAFVLGEGSSVGGYMLDGMSKVSSTAAMFLFAILFFSVLADAGLFTPIVNGVVRLAGNSPPRITLGTAIITSLVHLDGSGAATFLIVIPALVPVYDRLAIDRRVLACVVAMAAGVGNMLPWGGPTLRAATALNIPVMEFFAPVIPVYALGLASVLGLSWWIGWRHAPRLVSAAVAAGSGADHVVSSGMGGLIGPRYFLNLAIVAAVLVLILGGWLPPAAAFLLGTVAVFVANVPSPDRQRQAMERHAPAAITMVAILLSAGVFTGILRGTGMLEALANGAAGLLPEGATSWLSPIVGLLSMPLSLLFDPDSFYFGVLPVLSGIAEQGGASGLDIGHAAILGQMTTGFPVSPMTPATFLLIGLARIDLGDHQRFAFPYLYLLTLLMTVGALLIGVIRV